MDENEIFEDLELETEEAEGTAENPEEVTEENPEDTGEAEGAAEKPTQTPEERAKFADRDRKRQIEELRAEKEAMAQERAQFLEYMRQNGVDAASLSDVMTAAQKAEQDRLMAEEAARIEQEADETGIPVELLQTQAEVKQLREALQQRDAFEMQNRAMLLYEADKVAVSTVDPKFFESAGQQQLTAFGALRQAGFDALTAHSMVKAAPVKKDSGTGHMVPTGGNPAGATQGVEIPKDELSTWKEAFPDDTAAKLRERYNRSLKRQNE